MRTCALTVGLVAMLTPDLGAQATTRPQLLVGGGIAGQRDGNRDLGSGGVTADVGLTWRVSSIAARVSATIFSLPAGQGCSCDPGDPPLGVQGAYGVLAAAQSVPRSRPLYWIAGAGWRQGGFRTWNEHQSASVLAGVGWAFGTARRGAVEARYEHFLSPLGATRALLPLYFTWRL